ncbi:MAG: CoB--CoM heterodisulfide reductase iron-sulfur subunit B family protein [Candidatus Krumholzibacteriia bacterium]
MKIGYYPGCTLKSKARNLDESALQSLNALGVEAVELERWNCCGAVYNLADDDLVHFLAPVRDLIRARQQGYDRLLTLCSMCYNTLARANQLVRQDEVKRKTLNDFMDEEPDYAGEVEVVHLLPFLRDEVGWDRLREAVKRPLTGMNVAPYYGCTLTRPREVSIDGVEPGLSPQVFEEFIAALGATPVPFAQAETCCGSYNIISAPEAALDKVAGIVADAGAGGAHVLALSCPLCEYNLGRRQPEALAQQAAAAEGDTEAPGPLPVFYFTQLLALALGLPPAAVRLDLSPEASRRFLQEQGLLVSA